MKLIIDDPEVTEKRLRDAGFDVTPKGTAFLVTLNKRRVTCGEVADVLNCQAVDLQPSGRGVLVR